ncbi:MAG: alkaline phosphatase family protein [Candidatus Cybelea sp.]
MVNNPGVKANDEIEPDAGGVGKGTCFNTPSSSTDTEMTDMTTPYPGNQTAAPTATPCNEYTTILDYMASAAPSASPYYQWQYVAKDTTSIWSAPMAVRHHWAAYNNPLVPLSKQPFAVDPDALNFVLNVTGSTSPTPNPARPFAELTFLTPCIAESDHPNDYGPDHLGVDNGPQWLAWVVDSIESSSYWQSTAIIITWDDWGGFWDSFTPSPWPFHHTPPPSPYNTQDPNEWGFRVPLIVISPWVTKVNYVSSTLRSQGAILHFVENVFNLPSLNGDDSTNDDLSDLFAFSRPVPLPTVSAPTLFTPGPVGSCPSPSQL